MPIVSFRVTAEVHERLLNLAEERGHTLTALMQETTSHIVDRTQERTSVPRERISRQAMEVHERLLNLADEQAMDDDRWPPRAAYGSRLKKDKK